MNIENITKLYYPTKVELEEMALTALCEDFCGAHGTSIKNALLRNGISSISKLYETEIEELKKIHYIGETKLAYILQMKIWLEAQIDD